MPKTWMYSAECPEGEIFDSDSIPDGWVDSPAKINRGLKDLSKDELIGMAQDFGVKLDGRLSVDKLAAKVKGLVDGNSQ